MTKEARIYNGEKTVSSITGAYRGSLKTISRVTIWSGNLIPGHISRKDENSNLKRYMHPNVHSSIIYNSQDTEAT